MPQLTSPLSTPTGMPATNQAHLGKLAGARIHFATFADFTAAITTGTAFYSADLWADGQEMTIASETDSGAVRIWRAALGHARTVRVGRVDTVLPANSNVVLAAAGQPISGTGNNGDLSVDRAAGVAYLKTEGAWASAGNLSLISNATATAVEAARAAGSDFRSFALGPVDLIVFGSTPAGIAASIAAARLGKTVILVSQRPELGGMATSGVIYTDVNTNASPICLHGISREYIVNMTKETSVFRTFEDYYKGSAPTLDSWAKRTFDYMVAAEKNITVLYEYEFSTVFTVDDEANSSKKITSVTFVKGGQEIKLVASQYSDCSYTGDLVAAVGCTVSIGREANALYGETNNGTRAVASLTNGSLDPYITPGDSASGLIFGIDSGAAGTTGAGDGRVMFCTFRFVLTNTAGPTQSPIPLPDFAVYSASKYEGLRRQMVASPGSFTSILSIANRYTLTGLSNIFNHNSYTDRWSINYPNQAETKEYVTATPTRRLQIEENARQWILGLFYWLRFSGDAAIPSGVTSSIATYGVLTAENQKYRGFEPRMYLREGRRLVGDFVMKEGDISVTNGFTDKIGYLTYNLDAHNARFLVTSGLTRVEGGINASLTAAQRGAPIPYRVLLPKAAECSNLTAPVSPSVSRVVWTSMRVEPTLMVIGQAAGVAASLAIDTGKSIQTINTASLASILDVDRVSDGIVVGSGGAPVQGTIAKSAGWVTSVTDAFGYLGNNAISENVAGRTLTVFPDIEDVGTYAVYLKYPPLTTGRTTGLQVVVNHAGGSQTLTINQNFPGAPPNGRGGGDWEHLGNFVFRFGLPSPDNVAITTLDTVTAVFSACKFVKVN